MLPGGNFVYPNYKNSLVNLTASILSHFGLPPHKSPLQSSLFEQIASSPKMVLFVIDGLGYNLWEKEAEKSILFSHLKKSGLVEKITTVFPSSTATGLTSLNSGLTPYEHGLLEWNMYFRELEVLLETLPYKMIPTPFQIPHPLPENPAMLFTGSTLCESLAQNNIPSYYFLPKEFQQTVYTKAIAKSTTIVPFLTVADLMIALCHVLEETQGKVFCYVYWKTIDWMEHEYGPFTAQVSAEVALLAFALEHLFLSKLSSETRRDTAMVLTADHGQIAVSPEKTLYLNQFPQVTRYWKKSSLGIPILPTGSVRDVFLSIEDDKLKEVVAFLQHTLKDIAQVIPLDNTTIPLLFGEGTPHPEFLSRLGNVLILPEKTHTVWYEYVPGKRFSHRGHHGGLTPDEMYIPLVATTLSQLR